MSEKLFPIRKQCKTCRKKLHRNELVLDGLYDSYKCAGYPEPITELDKAPRGCIVVDKDGKPIRFKAKFAAKEYVREEIRNDASADLYFCDNCHFIHVGHSRALGTEEARLIKDLKQLATVMIKLRGNRDIKYVASKINTRPIRIKEIENADKQMDITVLFALIHYYRAKINLLLPN